MGEASGGGLSNTGSTTLSASTVANNTARAAGTGISAGGGVANTGNLTLSASTVAGNTARGFDTQGGGVQNGGNLTLDASAIEGNAATSEKRLASGGGLSNAGTGTAMLSATTVANNTARTGGNPHNTARAIGGGVVNFGNLTLTRSLLSHNALAGNATLDGTQLFHLGTPFGLVYLLPAPLGHWLGGVLRCDAIMCGGVTQRCSEQPCNVNAHAGAWLAHVPAGAHDGDAFPPQCAVGSYAASDGHEDQDSQSCSGPCPAGRACLARGTYTLNGTKGLPRAPPGTFTVAGDLAPHPCPIGTYADGGAAGQCDTCLPQHTTLDAGATSAAACVCAPTFFSDGAECPACPGGSTACECANTTLATLPLTRNHWRLSARTTDIRACNAHAGWRDGDPTTCRGNAGNATDAGAAAPPDGASGAGAARRYCYGGLTGPLCRVCVDEWHYLDWARARCTRCDVAGPAALALPLGLGLALTAATGLFWRLGRRFGRLAAVGDRLARLGLTGKAKVALGYFQVVLVMPEAFDVALPPDYFEWMRSFEWVNLDWFSVAAPGACVGDFSGSRRWVRSCRSACSWSARRPMASAATGGVSTRRRLGVPWSCCARDAMGSRSARRRSSC